MLKLSSNNFYKNHSNELIKFYNTQFKTLHIINGNDQSRHLFSKNTTFFVKEGEDVIEKLDKTEIYDQLILTNFIENSQDFVKTFPKYEQLLSENNKVIISSINSKWNIFVVVLATLKIIKSRRPKNYITKKTIENTFKGFGYTLTKNYTRQIFPFKLFYIGTAINIILEILFFRFNLGLKSYYVFVKNNSNNKKTASKTLLIPAKNEEGNLDELINRINLDSDTQIIFIIAKSKDKTFEKAQEISKNNKEFKFLVLEQNSDGKKNAVNEALPYVENELVAILDSDISVDPEELNNFFEIIEKDLGDFVNGTRLGR